MSCNDRDNLPLIFSSFTKQAEVKIPHKLTYSIMYLQRVPFDLATTSTPIIG